MQLQPHLTLDLAVEGVHPVRRYVAYYVGAVRYGLATTLPQLLNRHFPLPVSTRLSVAAVVQRTYVQFKTAVLGYLDGREPQMVLAAPTDVQAYNRRERLRLPLELPVGFLVGEHRVEARDGTVVNLSAGGCLLHTTRSLSVGAPLHLSLPLGEDALLTQGVVRWGESRGSTHYAGIAFRDLNDAEEIRLSRYLFQWERALKEANRLPR